MSQSNGSYKSSKNLQGQVVVITGASSGAGRATALEFARHGARLVLGARRLNALQDLVNECSELGADAIAKQTDVTDANSVKQLAQAANDYGGRIDVWINNAGVMAAGGFTETPVEVHEQVIKINLLGYIYGAHAVLPYFKQQGAGILINNISVGGFFPTPYAVGYSASKFGLRGYSDALKAELLDWKDIHVCDLYPAFLDTPGIQHAANYTGKVLKPAPPVYDPQKLARAMVRVALRPRNSLTMGAVAYMLHAGYFLLPGVMRLVTAKFMQTYLKQAETTPATSGNVFEPLAFGASMHGGWSKPVERSTTMKAAMLIGGLAASMIFAKQLSRRR